MVGKKMEDGRRQIAVSSKQKTVDFLVFSKNEN
jgi:hypothetical protein